jgi:hypothetical protein
VIVHATAQSPLGPFQRQEEILNYFAHEPTVVKAGDEYVMFKIGCADGAVTGSNETGLVGPCTGCVNGTTGRKINHHRFHFKLNPQFVQVQKCIVRDVINHTSALAKTFLYQKVSTDLG